MGNAIAISDSQGGNSLLSSIAPSPTRISYLRHEGDSFPWSSPRSRPPYSLPALHDIHNLLSQPVRMAVQPS